MGVYATVRQESDQVQGPTAVRAGIEEAIQRLIPCEVASRNRLVDTGQVLEDHSPGA